MRRRKRRCARHSDTFEWWPNRAVRRRWPRHWHACLEEMKGKSVGVVVSGGNVDAAEYARILMGG
jgi:hypothetical protein